jgi:hypothetical protein
MIGTYTWPSSGDVCSIFSRGRKPSCTACRATENDPAIAAWDAMTVATAASTTMGK